MSAEGAVTDVVGASVVVAGARGAGCPVRMPTNAFAADVVRAFIAVVATGCAVVGVRAFVAGAGVVGTRITVVAVGGLLAITGPICRMHANAAVADVLGAFVVVVSARNLIVLVVTHALIAAVVGAEIFVVTIRGGAGVG
jgi:hypothetical protein